MRNLCRFKTSRLAFYCCMRAFMQYLVQICQSLRQVCADVATGGCDRNFHSGRRGYYSPGSLRDKSAPLGSRGEAPPQKLKQFGYCLQILTAATIKILKFHTIYLLILDQYMLHVGVAKKPIWGANPQPMSGAPIGRYVILGINLYLPVAPVIIIKSKIKAVFYNAFNAIFGKSGTQSLRGSSVCINEIENFRLPVLLYGKPTDVCPSECILLAISCKQCKIDTHYSRPSVIGTRIHFINCHPC